MQTRFGRIGSWFCMGMAGCGGAWAWGPVGHETVAYIAADHLSAAARKKVAEILGPGIALADVSNWADEIRQERPETASWHYINIPDRARVQESDEFKYCPQHGCVVDQIELDVEVLKNPSASADQKNEALKFLIHFVGDIHQPLHCADDDDYGGNKKKVRIAPAGSETEHMEPVSLHAYWDHLLEMPTTDDPRALAARLEKKISGAEEKKWRQGIPADWAWESYGIARRDIYSEFKPGPTPADGVPLPKAYATAKMRNIVDMQLEKAGIRLAYLLNSIF